MSKDERYTIGQRQQISDLDAQKINIIYCGYPRPNNEPSGKPKATDTELMQDKSFDGPTNLIGALFRNFIYAQSTVYRSTHLIVCLHKNFSFLYLSDVCFTPLPIAANNMH